MGDVEVAAAPIPALVAILKRQLHAPIGGPACQGAEDLAEAGNRLRHRSAGDPPRKPGHDPAAEVGSAVDERLPVSDRFGADERVAVDPEGTDPRGRLVGGRRRCGEDVGEAAGQVGEIATGEALSEAHLERLEAVREKGRDDFGRAVVGRHERADADVVVAVHRENHRGEGAFVAGAIH